MMFKKKTIHLPGQFYKMG